MVAAFSEVLVALVNVNRELAEDDAVVTVVRSVSGLDLVDNEVLWDEEVSRVRIPLRSQRNWLQNSTRTEVKD